MIQNVRQELRCMGFHTRANTVRAVCRWPGIYFYLDVFMCYIEYLHLKKTLIKMMLDYPAQCDLSTTQNTF